MSYDQPVPGPPPGNPPTNPTGTGPTTEYLGGTTPPRRHRGRVWAVVVVAAVAVVALAGATAWAVVHFLGAGPQPVTAAPANTLAYVGLDLDPSGGQKLEALRIFRKFPALKDELGIASSDDLEQAVLEKLVKQSSCTGLDYDQDIKPWIGDKVGFGMVPGGQSEGPPVPFGVVQVTDEDKARTGVDALEGCDSTGGTKLGIGFINDYMVVAETDSVATRIVDDVENGSLADDPTYQKWVDRAGGDGILTGYLSPDGATAVASEVGPFGENLTPGPMLTSTTAADEGPALDDFEGGAVVARFEDESLKVELAAGGLPTQVATGGDSGVTDLPSSTAVAFGFGVSDDYAQKLIDGLRRSMGSDQVDAMLSEVQSSTGLSLPEDLQTLLGDGVSVAVDDSVDLGALFGGSGSPSDLPVGLRINGDPATIMPVLQKLLQSTGAGSQGLVVEQRDQAVALGLSSDYVKRLADDGDLGGQSRFTQALPDLQNGGGALYVDFDAGDWLVHTLDSAPDSDQLRANLQPLSALGLTADADGSTVHAVLRLSTD